MRNVQVRRTVLIVTGVGILSLGSAGLSRAQESDIPGDAACFQSVAGVQTRMCPQGNFGTVTLLSPGAITPVIQSSDLQRISFLLSPTSTSDFILRFDQKSTNSADISNGPLGGNSTGSDHVAGRFITETLQNLGPGPLTSLQLLLTCPSSSPASPPPPQCPQSSMGSSQLSFGRVQKSNNNNGFPFDQTGFFQSANIKAILPNGTVVSPTLNPQADNVLTFSGFTLAQNASATFNFFVSDNLANDPVTAQNNHNPFLLVEHPTFGPVTTTPEPGSFALLGCGLLTLVLARRRASLR